MKKFIRYYLIRLSFRILDYYLKEADNNGETIYHNISGYKINSYPELINNLLNIINALGSLKLGKGVK